VGLPTRDFQKSTLAYCSSRDVKKKKDE